MLNRRALVVSLHDVSPDTREACDSILHELSEAGATPTSLLVIPHHHHRRHFLEDEAFVSWLRTWSERGHEVVIHGYYHQRERREREGLIARATTRFYTAGEGEFYDIDRATALERYRLAREEFARAGFHPEGFIAPAWLLSSEAESALRESGCSYTTRLRSVADFRTGLTHGSQSLVWSVRSAWRRRVSVLWNALLFRRLQSVPLLRISVHPVDRRHPRVWEQIRALAAEALRTRDPMTYAQWISTQREPSAPTPALA